MTDALTLGQHEVETRSFIQKVYSWMSVGLAVTGGVGVYMASEPAMIRALMANRPLFYGLLIAELALVVGLAGWIRSMSAAMATGAFLFYAALNGVTISAIFLIYTSSSIANAFFLTAGTFALMSFYGYVTKTDLTTVGNLCFMGLLGLILGSLVNLWLRSPAIEYITTYGGILIFTLLIAYDTQKIKNFNVIGNEGTDEDHKEAISGALSLYLDFVNLFLRLLRVTGQRRR